MNTNLQIATDDQIANLLAQIAAETLRRGFNMARADDPNSFSVAARLMAEPGCHAQLRISLRPDGSGSTAALVVDAEGEPLAQIFEIKGQAGTLHA